MLQFDVATDRGGATRTFYPQDPENSIEREEVDRLFAFSQPLGVDYSGLWTDASTLVVTITNSTDAAAALGVATVSMRDVRGGLLFNAAGNSASVSGSAVLGGSFGSSDPPAITGFVIEDLDNADTAYGEGDSLFIVFDRATDLGRGAAKGAEAFVGGLFDFSHALGSRYSGEWQDASSFVVTIVNATGEGVTTDGCCTLAANIRVTPGGAGTSGEIRNRASVSGKSVQVSTALVPRGAGVGSLDPPILTSFVASDPDGGDRAYGVGDSILITFHGRSNKGAHRGGKAFVDSLFDMVPLLGDSYSGTWADGSTFVVDVMQASNALSDYTGAFQTTPLVLQDDMVVCEACLLYTSPSPRDRQKSRMPSSA